MRARFAQILQINPLAISDVKTAYQKDSLFVFRTSKNILKRKNISFIKKQHLKLIQNTNFSS